MNGAPVAAPRGRAMLSWNGKHAPGAVEPAEIAYHEQWGTVAEPGNPDSWTGWPAGLPRAGLLLQGDNKHVLARLLAEGLRGQVKLVYIDPPFDSGADYVRRVAPRGSGSRGSGIVEHVQYTDVWKDDTYLQFMFERLLLLRDLLRPDGALYLHCNTARSHHLRALLDEVFGPENFRNEIVVRRIRKNIRERKRVPRLNDGFDQIFFYANGPAHRVLPPEKAQPRDERWHAFDAPNLRPNLEYELFGHRPPPGRHWLRTEPEARAMIERGDLRPHPRTGKPEYRIPASTHVLRDSLWDDITASAFATGYPTEKKPDLLRLVVGMSSDPGDVVLDAFAGSGTTLAVAQEMGRRWIGVDANSGALHTTARRLRAMMGRQQRSAGQGTLLADGESGGPAQLGFAVYGPAVHAEPGAGRLEIRTERTGEQVRVEILDFVAPEIWEQLPPGADPKDWRTLIDAVLIDPAFDGAVFRPTLADAPERRTDLVAGSYRIAAPAGSTTLAVKLVDVLGRETLATVPVP